MQIRAPAGLRPLGLAVMPFRHFPEAPPCDASREKTCVAADAPGRAQRSWSRLGLMVALLLAIAPPARAAVELPSDPFEETELFTALGAVGTLVLPAGAPDRRTPAIVILEDGEQQDGRASLYVDQLLGAGFAVLEMVHLPGDSLEAVLAALALHPRVEGQPLGLLGFGAGARMAAEWPGPMGARALLYPGCAGLVPAAMQGEAVLLMHGTADPSNERGACARLGQRMDAAGVAVRLRVLERASYAWDRPAFSGEGRALLPRPDGAGRVVAEAWPELAVLSASEVAGFFATSLLGQRP